MMLKRLSRGLYAFGIESQVFRPIMTAFTILVAGSIVKLDPSHKKLELYEVINLKKVMSPFIKFGAQASLLFAPICPSSPIAAMQEKRI